MNGLNIPLGLVQGPGLLGIAPQQQQPQEAFQWGAGGQRMTRDAIERQRQIAASLMKADTSPVYDPWQGVARVLQNVVGGFQERGLRKRERENNEYSQQIMNELIGGPLPAAEGGAGSSPPASPSPDRFAALMADPYASDSVKQMAKMQYDEQIWRQRKEMERQIANDTATWEDNAGNRWKMGPNGPVMVFHDLNQKVTPQKVYDQDGNEYIEYVKTPNAYNPDGTPAAQATAAAPQMPPVGARIPDPRRASGGGVTDDQAGAILSAAQGSKVISRSDLNRIQSALGPQGVAASRQWLQKHGIKVAD